MHISLPNMNACCRYKMAYRQKLLGPCLNRLHAKYVAEQQAFLNDHKGFGRAVTGDGATIMGTKYINFLVHEFGKGVMLLSIHDCTQRLQEAGTIDATYIANRLILTIRFCFTYLVIFFYLLTLLSHHVHRSAGAKRVYLFGSD